jgi:hypothetical protein
LSGGVESWEVVSNGEDFIDPSFENVTHTSDTAFRFLNFRVVNNTLFAFKFEFDFKQLRLVFLFGVDLLIQVIEGKNDTITDTISDNGIDVLSVLFPLWLFLIELDSIIDFLQQFMDNNTAVFDTDQLVGDDCFQNVVVFFR